MRLTVLGSGTCLPIPGRSASGLLLTAAGERLLLDAGPGTLTRLQQAGFSYRELEHVFISHLHSDHTLDIATLLQACNATPGWRRTKALHLYGSRALPSFLKGMMQLFEGTEPESYALIFHEVGEEPVQAAGWSARAAPSGHTVDSLACRIESQGKSFVYSGDAAVPGAWVELARQADLLLCECSLPDGWEVPDHLTAGEVGKLAQAAEVRRVVLTHLYPPALEADVVAQVRAHYRGPVALASDGWTTEV